MRAMLVALLVLLGGVHATLAQDETTAQQLFESRCAFCHGVKGKGDGVAGQALDPAPPDFTSAEFWKTATPEKLHQVIMDGEPGTAMVPFRDTLKPAQIDALVKYVRSFAPK